MVGNAVLTERRREHSEDVWVIFGEFQTLSKVTFLPCKDFWTSPDLYTQEVGRYIVNYVLGSQVRAMFS